MGTDGTSPLVFEDILVAEYLLGIRHVNHLAIRTATPIVAGNGGLSYDFTTTAAYGTDAQNTINGIYILHAGDVVPDGSINAGDRSATWNERNQSGYLPADANLDGNVNAADRSETWNNRNKSEQW